MYYPLAFDHPTTKLQVNSFWAGQPFRLRLRGYQDNCKWCWKKSKRKHLTQLREDPSLYDFPERMEREYGHVGPEFLKDPATRRDPLPSGYRRVFYRDNLSTLDLRAQAAALGDDFVPAADDRVMYDPDWDVSSGCEESCEVYGEDDRDDAKEAA